MNLSLKDLKNIYVHNDERHIKKSTFSSHLKINLIFGFSYLFLLSIFVFIWTKYPFLLYMYRDGEYNLWITLKYASWANPLGVTSINPLQGMTSMLVAVNPYFNPGQWVFFTHLPQGIMILTAYAIYTLEIYISTLLLGITLGFSRLQSFIGSILMTIFLVPPFNFLFGLGGWLCGSPMLAHTLALSNFCVIIYLKLGGRNKKDTIVKNLFLIATFIFLCLLILMASPFYNAGSVLGTVILLFVITLLSANRAEFFWRVVAALMSLLVFCVLKFPDFYTSSKIYSSRFLVNEPFFSINWNFFRIPFDFNISEALNMFTAYGLGGMFPNWPLNINSIWVHLGIILGGIFSSFLNLVPPKAAQLGRVLATLWTIVLLVAILLSFKIIFSMFSPYNYFLMMYSLCALYSSFIFYLPMKILKNHFGLKLNPTQILLMPIFISVVLGLVLLYLFRNIPVQMPKLSSEKIYSEPRFLLEERHSSTPIINLLRQEIALQPGSNFRGLVATIYGSPEGALRKQLKNKTASVAKGQYEEYLTAAASVSGSTHDLLDLWTWDIPTLSEYGQGISRPLMFYITKFLTYPEDAIETNFAFPHKININILEALGVRFVITDAPIQKGTTILRHRFDLETNTKIFLYELPTPNLGNYSPTNLEYLNNLTEFQNKLNKNSNLLKTHAYVNEPLNIKLTPALESKMVYQKNGVHIISKSNGTSALLIPVQFSNCYHPIVRSGQNIKIMRANLIHTLIIFQGDLDLTLDWNFSWTKKCRKQDVMEIKNLLS